MHAFDARADDRSSASRILYAPVLKTALDCSRRACRAAADTRTHTVRHPNAGRAPRGRLEPVPVPAPARVAPKVWWTRASSSRARHTRDGRSREWTRARATRRRTTTREGVVRLDMGAGRDGEEEAEAVEIARLQASRRATARGDGANPGQNFSPSSPHLSAPPGFRHVSSFPSPTAPGTRRRGSSTRPPPPPSSVAR